MNCMQRKRQNTALLGGLVVLLAIGAIAFAIGLAPRGQAQDGGGNEEPPILQYPEYEPTPTIGPAPAIPPALSAAPLYQTDFADAAAFDAWEIAELEPVLLPESGSIWEVRDGQLAQLMTEPVGSPDSRQTAAVVGDDSWQDVVVSVNAYDLINGVQGLIARRNGDNYYRFSIIADYYPDTPKVVLEKVVDGVVTELATLDGPGHVEREWHTLSLRVVGGELTASMDGQVLLQATDPTPLAGGQAGIYTRAFGGILFDDFVVSQP
jgi:hypothetical protein